MPIISISVNESLKKFINKLVSKNQYENKSKVVRDALLRLMSADDISMDDDSGSIFMQLKKSIIGNMIIVIPQDHFIQKKFNKIETKYKETIVSKNQYFNMDSITVFMVFEGSLQEFQKIVVEINGIKEIKNFRYLIIN